MFDQFVRKIRNVDSWPEAVATVVSVERYNMPADKFGNTVRRARISFWYRDGNADIQSGEYTIDEDSPLFDQEKETTFAIRYNPAHPDRYWTDEYSPTGDRTTLIVTVLVIAAVILFAILGR